MTQTEIKGETQILGAICAHSAWRRKLSDCIDQGKLEKSPEEIACNDKCAFGQWLSGLTPAPDDPLMRKFAMIDRLHTRFHLEAGKIAVEVEKGNSADARALYEAKSFRRLTNSLILNLHDWRQDFKALLNVH